MTAPIGGSVLTGFSALPSMEAQIVYLLAHAVSLQNTYNSANPTTPVNKVAIAPNYSTNVVTGQIQFGLQSNTVETTVAAGVVAFLP